MGIVYFAFFLKNEPLFTYQVKKTREVQRNNEDESVTTVINCCSDPFHNSTKHSFGLKFSDRENSSKQKLF